MDLALTVTNDLQRINRLGSAIRLQRRVNQRVYLQMMELSVNLGLSRCAQGDVTLQRTAALDKFVAAVAEFLLYLQTYNDMHRVVCVFKFATMKGQRLVIAGKVDQVFGLVNFATTVMLVDSGALAFSSSKVVLARREATCGPLRINHDDIQKALLAEKDQFDVDNSRAVDFQVACQRGLVGEARSRIRDLRGHIRDSLLIWAAEAGYTQAAQLLIEGGASVESRSEAGWTALMKAAQRGYLDVAKVLLKCNANIDALGPNGATALNIACEHDQLRIVLVLVNSGAGLELADDAGYTPLITAAQLGHSDVVQFLVTKGVDINARLPSGGTALLTAVWFRRMAVVRILLDNGADITLCGDFQNWSALTVSYMSGYIEFTQLIYERVEPDFGSSVDQPATRVQSDHDTEKPTSSCSRIDKKHRNGDTALRIASEQGDLEAVKKLLKHRDDIDRADTSGCTPLMSASRNGHIAVVRLLLDERARVDALNADGQTALSIACQYGHLGIIQEILRFGTSIDLSAIRNGRTALHYAAESGHAAVAAFLCTNRAAVDLVDSAGWTALMLASQNGHADVVHVLLQHGARVDHQGLSGVTALVIACQNGHLDAARALINGAASIDLQDEYGYSALVVASMNGCVDVVKLLLDSHASIDLADKNGRTALVTASRQGHTDIVRVLQENGAQTE